MSETITSFNDALEKSEEKKHLLLGNGFSISWKKDIFKYDSLYEKADFKKLNPNIKEVFNHLGTKDFEMVMRFLMNAALTLNIYSPEAKNIIKILEKDASELKNLLVNTIADNHPENPNQISESEYSFCNKFLDHFESIYTLNYDLLLYWVIMHFNQSTKKAKYDDGFRTPENGKAEYVTWDIEKTKSQNIFYLHGALHLFDEGSELQKYTWINTGIKLIDQIRDSLNRNLFPVFVSEGSSKDKKQKIMHSNYLSRAYRSFASIGGSLFLYGHSLAENDQHIIELIPKSKISSLFVSIYGNPNSPENKLIIAKTNSLIQKRIISKRALNVFFYRAEDTPIWR